MAISIFAVIFGQLVVGVVLFGGSEALTASHLYQLQETTFSSLKNSNYTYYIVSPDDYSDADGGPVFTRDRVSFLKNQGKIVLAYISVGAVENFQDYWQKNWREGSPAWLEKEIPQWPGNFRVRFWMPELQNLVITFLKTHVLTKGFSGIYMDGMDSYEYFQEQGRTTAAQEMIQYVARLRNEARALQPGTLIFPQNSVDLYKFPVYRGLVDGFGIEDTWFLEDRKQNNYHTTETLQYLRMAKADGKKILSVDYPKRSVNVCTYYQKCFAEGFSCAVNDLELTGIVRSC